MDDYLKNKVEELVKSMNRKVREKNAIADVLDSDRIAEMSPDSISTGATGVMNKKDEECECKSETDECECEEESKKEIKKEEQFVRDIVKNFKAISDAYMKKMEKHRMTNPEEKRNLGYDKQSAKYKEKQKEIKGTKVDLEHPRFGEDDIKTKTDIKTKDDKKMAASEDKGRCWDGYEPTPGKKPYSKGSCQKKNEKAEKPFHGYNKEKHSKEGGLSEKERNRINKETGSNLKAPVSAKEAKKSPKKAARRKSFCARMKGNKGATSKDGKLTPKGAALKRWDC